MSCRFHAKLDSVFKIKPGGGFKSPCGIRNFFLESLFLGMGPVGKPHGIFQHWEEECAGFSGTDNFAVETGIKEIRDPSDVIQMGMGEKAEWDLFWRHGPVLEWHCGVIAHGDAAIDKKGGAVCRSDEVTGAGDTVLGAQVPDFHRCMSG